MLVYYEKVVKTSIGINSLAELSQRIFNSSNRFVVGYKVTKNQRYVQLFSCIFKSKNTL